MTKSLSRLRRTSRTTLLTCCKIGLFWVCFTSPIIPLLSLLPIIPSFSSCPISHFLQGGDKTTRNKNIEFNPSDLQPVDGLQEMQIKDDNHAHDAGDAGVTAKSGDGSLENISLVADYENDEENSSRNNSVNYDKLRVAETTSSTSRGVRVTTPFESANKSPENIGYFFLLTNTVCHLLYPLPLPSSSSPSSLTLPLPPSPHRIYLFVDYLECFVTGGRVRSVPAFQNFSSLLHTSHK